MTYTTDQVVQMAQESGAYHGDPVDQESLSFSPQELTALCNKVERDTLLKAAEKFREGKAEWVALVLKEMAGEE